MHVSTAYDDGYIFMSNVYMDDADWDHSMAALDAAIKKEELRAQIRQISARPQYPAQCLRAGKAIFPRIRANLWSGARKREVAGRSISE